MTDANHIGDLNEMVIGDNDHGDSTPTPSEEPKCSSCGVPWVDHMGIMGTCADNKALREDLKDSLEAHDEMRLEIAQLRNERDEARQLACEFCVMDGSGYSSSYRAKEDALARGWDCYDNKKEKTQ